VREGDPPDPVPLSAVYRATFFVRFGFGLIVAVFAAYIAGRSVGLGAGDVGTVGLVSAAAPIGEFSTVLFSGVASDRYGRFPVLLSGMAAAAALLVLVSLVRLPLPLAAFNLLFGVSSGAILASSLAVVADRVEREHRGLAMGRFDAVNLLGWILGFAVGFGLLGVLPNAELPWIFRGGAALLAVGLLYTRRLLRDRPEGRRPGTFDWGRIRDAIARREVLLVTLPWLVIYMLIGTGFVFLGSASTGAGVPATYLALLIGGGGLVLLLTQPYFGRLADRHGRMRLMGVGTGGFVALLASVGLLASFGPRPALLGVAGVSVLFALAYGPAALASLGDLSKAISRGTTMAVYTLVISLGMLLGLLVSTSLFSRFGTVGIDVFLAGVAIGLVALTTLRWHDLRTGRGVEYVEEGAGTVAASPKAGGS
jgi:MFS family permease